MQDSSKLSLDSREIGPVPVVRRIFERLGLDSLLERYVPGRTLGRRRDLSHARALSVMVQNIILSRSPLYGVPEWIEHRIPELFGLSTAEVALLQDDRIGRALDALYETDPASLMTAVVTKAVREFEIDLSQIHNDSTTVTFSGAYEGQKSEENPDRPPLITFGHNKDHRPDLKQIVYALTISADGAVPIHYKSWDGNTTDDQTHQETWSLLRGIAGRSDFTYVADSKLCTRENMKFIHEKGGRFVTVLPRSRKEDDDFREYVQLNVVPWEEVLRRKNPRNKDRPDHVYRAFEPPTRSHEGYRIIWFTSSVKAELDQRRRVQRIKRARQRIEQLEARSGAHRFRSADAARQAVHEVLVEEGAERWLNVEILEQTVTDLKQIGPGRPGRDTRYRKVALPIIMFRIEDNAATIQADARCDGLFAMVTNLDKATPREIHDIYKYQPFLEKRNEQLKSVLSVAPVFLKKPERVAALLFLYFLAVLIFALIEREVREGMKAADIPALPLYPEGRLTKRPTTALVLQALEGLRRHRLLDGDGNLIKVFYDAVPDVVTTVLRLLRVSPTIYGVETKP